MNRQVIDERDALRRTVARQDAEIARLKEALRKQGGAPTRFMSARELLSRRSKDK